MKRKTKADLQVVSGHTAMSEATGHRTVPEELRINVPEEEAMMARARENHRQIRKKTRRKVMMITFIVLLILTGSFLLIHFQTYTTARVITTYPGGSSESNSYKQFAGGVLRYGRNGVVFLDERGEERWNLSYQIKIPIIEVNEKTAVLADKGGNDIVVMNEEGLKGEIHTTLPIEKVAVSRQGIVSAVLKMETGPKILTYDAMGNVLAEVKTAFAGAGYPLDIALSPDGKILLVSYMNIQNEKASTNVVYYSFGESQKESGNYQVTTDLYEDMLAPTTFFMNEEISVVVGDDRLLIYEGAQSPKLRQTLPISKEIKSVVHNQRYVALVLENEGAVGYELCLYNVRGEKVLSEEFTGDYSHVKLDESQVIMYDGKECSIFTRSGVHKFEGELDKDILEMFTILGVNKYIVMNADGMEVVRFVK